MHHHEYMHNSNKRRNRIRLFFRDVVNRTMDERNRRVQSSLLPESLCVGTQEDREPHRDMSTYSGHILMRGHGDEYIQNPRRQSPFHQVRLPVSASVS